MEPCSMWGIRPKLIFNSILAKFSSILPVLVVQSFWHLTQSATMILPCSVQISIRLGNCEISFGQTGFTTFGFKIRFGRLSYIAQPRRCRQLVTLLFNYFSARGVLMPTDVHVNLSSWLLFVSENDSLDKHTKTETNWVPCWSRPW